MSLPDPETVVARAREADTVSDADAESADGNAKSADTSVNLVVTGPVDADAVERGDDGYVGETAGAVGRLAAALTTDAAVHYPEPDFTADGPWLVLAPLSGFVSTVAKGRGRAVVALDYDASADPTLDRLDERVSALFDAARPSHDHYPVEDDDQGAFATGLTTFALDSLSVEEELTATFAVSTTPATRPSEVEARFADVASVEGVETCVEGSNATEANSEGGDAAEPSVEGGDAVEYEPVVGVERAAPSPDLREAVEAAHREVRGDCEYDWLPGPGAFAAIPGAEKMALGTGAPGAKEFSREQYEDCVDLLAATLSNLGVSA